MATTVARLEAILTANTRDFDRAMASSETKIQKTGRVAGIAGLAIAGGLAFGLDKSVKAALAAQVSQARLEAAFKTSGVSAAKYAKAVDALEASGRKLGFTDEQTKTSLGSLLIATHSMSKASADLSVAQDIARFKHVDLATATKSLTMAMAGSQRALKQLGIDVPKVTLAQDALHRSSEDLTTVQGKLDLAHAKLIDKQRTAALVIETVRQKLGGQAEAYSKTAAGGMEQFRAQLDHLEVSMGTGLLPILAKVAGALSVTVEWFSKHNAVAKITITVVTALGAAMLLTSVYTKVAASSFATKLIPALARSTAAMLGFDAAADANPIGAVTVAVVALAAALVVLQLRYQAVTRAVDFLKTHLYLLLAVPVVGWALFVSAQIVTHWATIVAATQRLKNAIESIGGAVKAMWGVAKGPIDAMGSAFRTVVKAVNTLIDEIKWLISHIPHIPSVHIGVPHIPYTNIGDASGVGPPVKGPASIDRSLYDELGDAYRHHLVLTSGYRPGAITKHGTPSDHGVYPSKAIDVSGSAPNMASFFESLIGDKGVKQAFYDPLGSIFGGVRNNYREGGHSDHVHVATYDQGGWLKPGLTLALNNTGRPEPVGTPSSGVIHEHHYHGPVMQDAAFVRYLEGLGARSRRRG